jgi:hypothetical protein
LRTEDGTIFETSPHGRSSPVVVREAADRTPLAAEDEEEEEEEEKEEHEEEYKVREAADTIDEFFEVTGATVQQELGACQSAYEETQTGYHSVPPSPCLKLSKAIIDTTPIQDFLAIVSPSLFSAKSSESPKKK